MNKGIKFLFTSLIFLLFVSHPAAAAHEDLSISHVVLLEDRTVDEAASGNVIVVLGNGSIQSDIQGNLIVVFGQASVKGNVSGDVVSVFSEVDILNGTRIMGNLVSIGKLDLAVNVVVKGTEFLMDLDFISPFKTHGVLINALILYSLVSLVLGLLLITVFSDRYRVMSYSMGKRMTRRMILGGLAIIGITILLVFLIFFFVAPILYTLILMFADIVAGIYAGTLIFRRNRERLTIYLEFLVGHILISILKIVPLILLPVGSYNALLIYGICFIIIKYAMAFFGAGILIDTQFGKSKKITRL